MQSKPTATKTQLALQYGVSYNTFLKWLKEVPDLKLKPKQRILTPLQISKVFKHLGDP